MAITRLIRTFATSILLLYTPVNADSHHQDMPTRQRAAEDFTCSELLQGEGAPTMAAIVQAVRVAIDTDPRATLEVDEKSKSIRVEANPFGLAKTGRLFKSMRDAESPEKRLDDVQLYILKQPTRDGTGKEFFGREISQVMGHLGAGWLERPTREREERSSKMIDLLAISDGDDIADIGAGTGYRQIIALRDRQ